MTRTVIIDYESGNLHSAQKAFELMAREVGAGEIYVSSDPAEIARADRLVLPGDGAFPACAAALRGRDALYDTLRQRVEKDAVPFLGICVGMQLMADMGYEYEPSRGLGWIGGEVRKIEPRDPKLKVPHMGWNALEIERDHPVLEGIKSGEHVYFVHSYQFHCSAPSERLAYVEYAGDVTALIGRDNMVGMQFHPEKSQKVGLKMIANFLNWSPE